MRKYDFISALAQETAREVVRNRDEWMKYLTTAARLYKYPFREQLLIYSQRLIIPGLFEPPVRTLRATIPENESHIFR